MKRKGGGDGVAKTWDAGLEAKLGALYLHVMREMEKHWVKGGSDVSAQLYSDENRDTKPLTYTNRPTDIWRL